jgi:hypothetical protein
MSITRRSAVWQCRVATVVLALTTGGCGTTFDVVHIPQDQIAAAVAARPGIYYALPLTEFEVSLPVNVVLDHPGRLSGFDLCAASCNRSPAAVCAPVAKPAATPTATLLGPPAVVPKSAPDDDQIYRAEVHSDNPFIAVNHQFMLQGGRLTEAKLSSSNETLPLLASALSPLATLSGLGAGLPAPADTAATTSARHPATQSPTKPPPLPDACTPLMTTDERQLASRVGLLDQREILLGRIAAELDTQQNRALSCPEVRCIADTMQEFKLQGLHGLHRAQEFLLQPTGPVPAALAALRLDSARARSAELLARHSALKLLLGLDGKTEKYMLSATTSKALRPMRGPVPGEWIFGKADWRFDAPVELLPAQAEPYLEAARQELDKLVFAIKPAVTAQFGPAAEAVPAESLRGYRYRLPAQGVFSIKLADSAVFEREYPVAQFGRVAVLPSHFKGLDAGLSFALDNEGTLTSVTLGQKAQDTTALQTLSTTLEKRQSDRESAALKSAQGQNNLAAEQIKADKQRRCLEALKGLAGDAPYPDICK